MFDLTSKVGFLGSKFQIWKFIKPCFIRGHGVGWEGGGRGLHTFLLRLSPITLKDDNISLLYLAMSPVNTTLDFQWDSNGEWWLLAKNSFYFLQDVLKYTVFKHMHSKFAKSANMNIKISTIDMGYQKIQNFMLPKFVEMGFKMSRKKVVSKKYGAKFELIGFCTFRQCSLLITFVRNIFLNPYGNNLNRHEILCFYTPLWNLWKIFLLSYLYFLKVLNAYAPKMEHCQAFCKKCNIFLQISLFESHQVLKTEGPLACIAYLSNLSLVVRHVTGMVRITWG